MTRLASVADDIAYVRDLADRADRAPLLGGRFMSWWGALLTTAYLAHHVALSGYFRNAAAAYLWIWLPFLPVGALGHWLLARHMPAMAGSGSFANHASRAVWSAAALAVLSMVAGSAIAAQRGAGPATFDWVAPVGFAVYACSLGVTGTLAKNRVVTIAGVGAAIMVGIFTALILSPQRYLVAAAGVALVVLLPGLLLIAGESRGAAPNEQA